jgi:hypothetical protein
MGFLRFLWKDIRSRHWLVKIAGLVLGIALIASVWRLGVAWWMGPTNVAPWYVPPRMRPRLEYVGVVGGAYLLSYLASFGDRYRKRR